MFADLSNCSACNSICCKSVKCELLTDKGCQIYSERPLFCNVDRYFETYRPCETIEEWYNINLKSCELLRRTFIEDDKLHT